MHTVYVGAFYLERTEVTKGLWDSVYTWAANHGYDFDNSGLGKAADHPVQSVNWYDAVKRCNARSEMEGLTPAYYFDTSFTIASALREEDHIPRTHRTTAVRYVKACPQRAQ